ncbi:MAG: type IV pilin-like G/H family protein [Leptolyngbyaceae bacterium]|nr:type IV pilin-like G/H family protein [Leptolyngbyaceae bacterium]
MTTPTHSPACCHQNYGLWWRYLLHRYPRHHHTDRGLTLTELLISMIVMGILAAIALPSIVSHALKAKESEARMYVSAVSKGQQTYFMEYGQFSSSVGNLGVGIPDTTKHYSYQTQQGNDIGSGSLVALTEASQVDPQLRSFAGQVWLGVSGNRGLTTSIFCEGERGAAPPTITNHQCP